MKLRELPRILVIALLVAGALNSVPAWAGTYSYTDWSSATDSSSSSSGTASGTLTFGTQTIGVTYTGDIAFAQLNNSGPDYYNPSSDFVNATVANAPPTSDIVALSESLAYTDTIAFSSPVTDPVLDIVSLGQPGDAVSYASALRR